MTLTDILSFPSKLHLTCQNAAQEKEAQRRDGEDMTQVKKKNILTKKVFLMAITEHKRKAT